MTWRQPLRAGGLIGAACAACCVPPLVASVGVVAGLAAAAGLIGGIAAVVVLLAGVGVVVRRRQPSETCGAVGDASTPVAAPTRRV